MLQDLYDSFIATLTAKTDAVSAVMSGALSAPLTAAMTLYIILYGIAVMRGAIQEPVLDFAIRGIKLAIIWALVTSADDYTKWVSSTINSAIPDFIDTLTGGSGSLPSDPVMVKAGEIASKVQEEYASQGWAGKAYGYFMSGIVLVWAILFAAIAFVASLLATFGLTMMAAIGPIFICFALFDSTRSWFFAWLGQILNWALVKVLVIVLTVVIVAMLGDVYTKIDVVGGMAALAAFLVALSCGFVFFLLIPSVASGLAAGAQASTGMLQRSIERNLGLPTSSGTGSSRGSAART
ncbi:type IV secretion system protein [Sedimentitalea todarodis]|uniref:Type IV secretion system protein n=1 Tax=Sedimentitalea todarodis TaxID=1631240 RepID=A0ABU3VEZ0_9RHOB|nr:type IV secretion system protein [Sedimentitalea todarodis]MDU9004740.1 type IV secretion system protein [Sedimentitalea todarodis]